MDINEEIKNLTEAYANLLEGKDARGGAQKEVNKITRTKKDKNGEPVEVVSVADELFPYKGTAKEQYNQKILAKINDMIEGTATLDDLIQLVRSKQAKPVKESLQETLDKMMAVTEEIINEVSVGALARAAENSLPAREKENDDLEQKRQEIHKEGSKTKSKKKIEKLYNDLIDTLGKGIKANKRYNQAKNIVDLNLPKNSKVSVSKLVNSAKKSQVGRGLAHDAGIDVPYEKYKRTLQRVHRANDIADIRPNKSEANESFERAMSILEEIINEVSVKRWKEAAKNSIEGRKQAANDASDRFASVVYPFQPVVYDPDHKLGDAWDKAEQRADRAEQLSKNLPNSRRSANQLKQVAKKVTAKRDSDNEKAVDNLQNAVDKFLEKPYSDRTDKDYSDLSKVQNKWVSTQKKENRARNLVGKPERRPEKDSEGKHKLKEQGYIDRSKEA